MAKVEQVICGVNPQDPDGGRCLLSYSPGMGRSVSEEVLALCQGWGDEPSGGLDRPAVMSMPLRATMPALRGQLFSVIRVSTTVPALFHAVVLTKAEYRNFAYNPFAVIRSGGFLDVWSDRERLASGQITPPDLDLLFSPPPNPGDVGLVDEALREYLTRGKLTLNLEAPTKDSDRVLGLLIRLMPTAQREKLRFASFAPAGENAYGLVASFAKDTPFSSWQRLFMTMIEGATPEPVRKYISSVRNGLVTGDLSGVEPAARLMTAPSRKQEISTDPAPATLSSSALPLDQGRGLTPGSRPALSTRTRTAGPAITPAIAPAMTFQGGSSPASWSTATINRSTTSGRSRTPLVKKAVSLKRRTKQRKTRPMAVFLTLVAVLAAGWIYLDRSGKGLEWGIFDLAGLREGRNSPDKSPSLLEVVDVGREYQRLLAGIQRVDLVPGTDAEQARRRAQADLQARVAGPLLIQADLFLDLARDGIQQGKRPDRERERLHALNVQGRVVKEEMVLLELASYSLREGIFWQDLDRLNANQAQARRDSLAKAARGRFDANLLEIGTQAYQDQMESARRNVSGMASLLGLFQAENWSPGWEKELKKAAEKVSPRASSMSRAYRNNAFLLLRLKHAERGEAHRRAPYLSQPGPKNWPAPAVQGVLAEMRRKIGLFGSNEMPELLRSILSVYEQMADPGELARRVAASPEILDRLAAEKAVAFQPEVYGDFLSRIRFEAVAIQLAQGRAPEDLPAGLWGGFDREDYLRFQQTLNMRDDPETWQELAQAQPPGFLKNWASYQVAAVAERIARRQDQHDQAWQASRSLVADLANRAAQARDWTSLYVDLERELKTILSNSPASLGNDPVRSAQQDEAAEIMTFLKQPAALTFSSVVVRLDQDYLPGPAEVTVELQVDADGRTLRSAKLRMGPAAPENTGWVGTMPLDWVVDLSTDDSMTAVVRAAGRSEPLLEVHYPSLVERVGPGALVRPRRGESGSLVFRITDDWWRRGGLQ